jgi:NADPH:quinone reductase-like Zn-dependent oxidoreductase
MAQVHGGLALVDRADRRRSHAELGVRVTEVIPELGGEVCVVTGATSSIGKATATALARLGAQVVLVGRDRGRGEATAVEPRLG